LELHYFGENAGMARALKARHESSEEFSLENLLKAKASADQNSPPH
jgi:hypothetical protein